MTAARFAGTCACGCRRGYAAGAELVRGAAGWSLASCVAPGRPAEPTTYPALVLDTLARARRVADRFDTTKSSRGT